VASEGRSGLRAALSSRFCLSLKWELTEIGLGAGGGSAGGLGKEARWNGTNEAKGTYAAWLNQIKVVLGGIRVNQTKSNLLRKGRRLKG
jgi:hypothetical protein